MKTVGIIHTTPATIASLGALAQEILQDVHIVNILDDSILADMRDGHNVEFVRERWISYASTLEKLGVSAVLSACSTVGDFAEEADRMLSVPVYRIDEAMAEEAVTRGGNIAVFATLRSTLDPTVRLIQRKAKESGAQVQVETVLVEGAYEALMGGDKNAHDQKIADAVAKRLDTCNAIVLAQASMASAVSSLKDAGDKVLTSPRLGMLRLQKELEKQ